MASTTLPQTQPYSRAAVYEWITTVDHKKIGIMYMVSSFMFFLSAACWRSSSGPSSRRPASSS